MERCTLKPFAFLVALALAGCGMGFDPASEVTSLRVLGVQKSNPYPAPGETVDVSVLWHDGASATATEREVQLLWLPACYNPPGDQYTGCFGQFLERFLEEPDLLDRLVEGDTASFEIPADIVPPTSTPGNPRYGLTNVSFALCAGQVSFEAPTQEGALPLVCRDPNGERLGPESFVVAEAKLFSYVDTREDGQPFQNTNPTVQGFSVEGETLESCIDGDCLAAPLLEDIDCEVTPERCFAVCEKDGDEDCPEIDIKPLVDEASAEVDDVSRTFYDRNVREQMWINYYSERGSVRGDGVRLLNDAVTGWNEDFGIEFYAPKEPGLVTLWAVVHDNRGGMSWSRTQIKVR